MKFKTQEDLLKEDTCKVRTMFSNADQSYNQGICRGIASAFESITERKDFYLRYKGIPNGSDTSGVNLFRKDFPDIYKNADFMVYSWWNDWLFNFCFGDL